MNGKKNRRFLNFIINKDIQFRVAALNVIYALLILVITGFIALAPLLQDMYLSEDPRVQYQSAQAFLVLTSRLAPTIVCVVIMIVIHIMIATHRICGPMVNFKHTFESMAKGDLTRKVSLRKADYLKPEAEKINAMVDSISAMIFEIKTCHENLMTTLEKTAHPASGIDPGAEPQKSLVLIREEAQQIRERLDRFSLLNI